MEPKEKEYEYGNINNNQQNNNKIEISSLSIKSGIEESKSNHSIKNDNNIINFYKTSKNKLNIIISPTNKLKHNNTNNINNDKKSIFDYTDNLYNSDEHLSKIELIKSKNNQENVHNIFQIKRPQSYDKNFEQKISLSKHDDDNHKIYRKSLFNSKNKKEEDKKNESKKSLILIKNKKKENPKEFFKLMEKNKKPQKSSYIDSLINNKSHNSKFNSSIKKNLIKKNSFKSYTVQKVLQRNRTFNTQKEIIMHQKEKRKKEDFQMVIKKKNKINLEDMNPNVKDTQNSENTKNNNIKNINWPRIKFLCCLNCN